MESCESKLRLGAERPYAVFVVRGVTYSFSAPVVIPVDDLDDLPDIIEFDDDDDCESAPNNAVVEAPAPAPPKYRPSLAQWCYSLFAALGAEGKARASRSGWLPLVFDPVPTTPLLRGPRANQRSGGGVRGGGGAGGEAGNRRPGGGLGLVVA